MKTIEIKTNRTYCNNLNGKVVTVTGMKMATVEFEFNGVAQVPMLKTLFAANFSLFS